MSLRVLHHGGCAYAVEGELDMASVPALEETFTDVSGSVALDLSALTFVDSHGIAALLRLRQRCQTDGCDFWIDGCSRSVERVLRMMSLYAELSRRDSRS